MPELLTDSFSSSPTLFEQVRQRLQLSLGVAIRTRPVAGRFYPAGSQLWQIGSAPSLLVMRSTAAQLLPGPVEFASPRALLLYEYVPPRLAEHLRAQATSYADAAGNAWLHHPPLLVNVQGCPRPAVVARPAGPARQVNLLRLLFEVLHQPALLSCSLPLLAARTGLPLATVRQEQTRLLELGYWPAAPHASWPPRQLARAGRYWLDNFAPCLRRRLNAQRYCLRGPAQWVEWPRQQLPAGCWWGGEAAAHLLLGRPTAPPTLTLYSRVPRPQLQQQLHLLPHPRGPIELLNSFTPAAADTGCVPPLLVYADLLAGRVPAAALARELRARYLGPEASI